MKAGPSNMQAAKTGRQDQDQESEIQHPERIFYIIIEQFKVKVTINDKNRKNPRQKNIYKLYIHNIKYIII